jgi:hypothetical protein
MTGPGRMMRMILLLATLTAASSGLAFAQQRPLVTEDPETIGAGRILLELGAEYGRDQRFPVSGLTGDLLVVPAIGLSFGVSSIAEIQIDGAAYQRLHITSREAAPLSNEVTTTGRNTEDVQDIVVATKLRVVTETATRPSFGVRLATKLPNASNESGLGLDTMDFFATILAGKTTASTRYVGNIGLGIFGDPTKGDRQSDLVVYGFSIAHAIQKGVELVAEANGRFDLRSAEPDPGGESRTLFRVGARYTLGPGRIDAAVLLGATSRDPQIGFTVGYTHVFNAFNVP